MRVLVVYESMYGNTHLIAEEVANGLRAARHDVTVTVVPVADATPALVADAELLVVGGPTHVHTLPGPKSRQAAAEAASKGDGTLTMQPGAAGSGLREWFDGLGDLPIDAAAFDTRIDAPALLTGRASKGIAKRLRRHGAETIVEPESFLVTRDNHLKPHEVEHARRWGAQLASALVHA
jgi:hypothetical protein